jgi:hypothetical protein
VRTPFVLLAGTLVVSACGSSGSLQSAQSNKNVQQTETKVEHQVSRCLPTSHGTPDPLLLRHHAALVAFEGCTGVAKNGRSFDKCAIKVVLGGLPTASRLTKGLTACVEENA